MLSGDYPYVQYKSIDVSIDGGFAQLFTNNNNCMIDSIFVVNPTSHNAKFNINLIKNYAAGTVEVPFFSRATINANESKELLANSCLYLESFDVLQVYVDFSDNKLTFIISYRETNQQSGLSPALTIGGNTAADDVVLSLY